MRSEEDRSAQQSELRASLPGGGNPRLIDREAKEEKKIN